MALHILPPERSFGQEIGSILGTGLGQGLNMLAQDKLKSMQANKFAKSLEGIGIAPNVASFVSQQSPELQKDFLSRLEFDGAIPQQTGESGQSSLPGGVSIRPSKERQKEMAEKFKATKEFREGILNARKSARYTLKDLSRLEELSASGKLDTPGYMEFLSASGLDIPALMNPESEEFQKIQQSFLKDAKQYFGGRVSNYEVEQFLKTIPSLSQSPEGRKRVIANLKYMARGAEEYYKAYEEVLAKNKGVPPYDLQEEVERRIEPKLDRIYNQFRQDLEKPVPKGQNKFITALQAGLGKAAGNLGKGAAGAAAGGLIGANVGGLGAIPGAAIGGLAGLSGLGLKSLL